jgi:DNA-binding response OmpR family regulator
VTRILIILRDRRLGRLLEEGLGVQGCITSRAADPRRASALADYEAFDLAIVDRALEAAEGFDLLLESCTGPAAPAVIAVDTREPIDAGALLARAREPPKRPEEQKLAASGVALDP